MSCLLRPTFYAAIPLDEKDVATLHETKYRRERDRFCTSPLVLLFLALMIAASSAMCGVGIGMSLKEGEAMIPSWIQSLSRGTQEKTVHSDQLFKDRTDKGSYHLVELSWQKHTFHYNRTFAMAPTDDESTESPWDELVPRKPKSTPIFHQMPTLTTMYRRSRIRSLPGPQS